jgi:hypothetical protein
LKIDFNPARFLGEAAVCIVESDSRPGRFHYVMKLREGGVICTCEAFQFFGQCKHCERVPADHFLTVMKKWRNEG